MRSFVTCTVLATVASMAVAQVHPRFEYPDSVPAVEKRQEPGTPRYQCHEDCGLLITLGRQDGFCTNSEWNERYGRCMSCANTYAIWMYYSSGVTSAAAKCGLSPTPSPSGGAVETTAAATSAAPAPATTTAAPAPATTTAAAPPAASSSSAAAESSAPAASTSAAGAPATTLSTAASASGSASASASGAATTSGSAAGTSAATVTRVTSIGTSVVIPSGTATPSTPVFAGAGKNAAAMGLAAVGLALAAF
ncbi:hypothetical protein CPAR01_10677 [Colletotrichum paranaense]|uniref:Uncharacterized protein n=2 Tax=Colletotrichum acutatum species complex TaxID=2707335 RepID=A0AAI9TV01_9PEZI|nr:uncharacterized protein CPAR01_10677 [Colletotrichum paranaense]KAK1446366.1 hypothetical protein CMEL01_10609 [Colletotrichum melonis]KAK1533969.1 hypothetical protein CPAR01_10677 [Colletotrichum paranaense]